MKTYETKIEVLAKPMTAGEYNKVTPTFYVLQEFTMR